MAGGSTVVYVPWPLEKWTCQSAVTGFGPGGRWNGRGSSYRIHWGSSVIISPGVTIESSTDRRKRLEGLPMDTSPSISTPPSESESESVL
jgi:hypothetical protein